MSRFPVVLSLLGALLAAELAAAPEGTSRGDRPALSSIRVVTISSADPESSAANYERYLGYREVEAGTVAAGLAAQWQAPAVSGRPYVLLRAPDPQPVYLRFVLSRSADDYRPASSAGWNALELLVRDPYEIATVLSESPFSLLGAPAPLIEGSSIHAAQFLGPDREILYFTADLSQDPSSTLARTRHRVGRPFIVVLAHSDLEAASAAYRRHFGLAEALRMSLPIPFMAALQALRSEHLYSLSLLRLAAFSHAIEIDEYPRAPARAPLPGELPAGIAVISFCTTALDGTPTQSRVPATAISGEPGAGGSSLGFREAARIPGAWPADRVYGGRAPRVLRGPAGELMELLDCEPAGAERGPAALH